MQDRDARDRSRSAAPLRPADDAIIVDTSKMDAAAVLAFAKLRISAFT
jgi:cytidylate kinase